MACETEKKGAVAVPAERLTGILPEFPGDGGVVVLADVRELVAKDGESAGLTRLKMLATFICDGAISTNCLVKSPGGQPGTSISSATLLKSRSLNTR